MRIGIFGGSFDPVHLEHRHLVERAIQNLALDKLFIVPARVPPHKQGKSLCGSSHRLKMCEIMFKDVERAAVDDFEISSKETSYTYLTCRHFKSLYPTAELFFLVGTDMLRDFPNWKQPEDILQNARLAVAARNEDAGWIAREQAAFRNRFCVDFLPVGYDGLDVSSTKIRAFAAAGEDVSAYTGEAVARYIAENGLYAIAGAKEALALEKPSRKAHSLRVACLAAEKAGEFHIDERAALTAALFHDCAKNLSEDSPYLEGFVPPEGVPDAVLHQYAGAYVAEHTFHVTDEETLDAIRFHTSGRAGMTTLQKIIYLSDMLEEGRSYEGVETLRALFRKGSLDSCFSLALEESIKFIEEKGQPVYRLTREALEGVKEYGK